MYYREELEKRELEILSPLASKSVNSIGRRWEEEPCVFRTCYQRDRDRIIHSKSFRRLMHKTQVFLSPEGDHYRTRLTHTLEVSQVARTICRSLNLNEDLTEAIALGHDLGHTPFGHTGESILNDIHPGGFRHNEQSLRVVEVLESGTKRQGMNLTYEVRDGILNHTGDTLPSTLEGQIVKISDRIAYINHDIDDAIRSGVLTLDELPEKPISLFGNRHSERINSMANNVVINSDDSDVIKMDDEHWEGLIELRDYMFKNVYRNPKVKKEKDLLLVEKMIKTLYDYYVSNPDKMPEDYTKNIDRDGVNVAVKDYVSGMTDRYATLVYEKLIGD